MKCPFCNELIEGKSCSLCGRENPADAVYCTGCGNKFEDMISSGNEDEIPDIDDRELCPDGACTGIIINNRCTECGKIVG